MSEETYDPPGYHYIIIVKHGEGEWEFTSFPPEVYTSWSESKAIVEQKAREHPGTTFGFGAISDNLVIAMQSVGKYAPKALAVAQKEIKALERKQ